MQRKFGRPTTLNDIIETAIVEIAKHQLVNGGAGIIGSDGQPVKVVKFRNFSGVEVKTTGLTLSIFPYDYEGASRPTPESTNASVSFKPYGFQGPDPTRPNGSIDFATANIKIRLDLLGYSIKTKPQTQTTTTGQRGLFGTTLGAQTFEVNEGEEILRSYLEYIRVILSTDLFNLNNLVQSSFVTWYNLPTTKWDSGGNAVLHTAELMWQVYYYPLRDWRPDHIVRGKHPLIGAMQADGAPVFYRPEHNVLVTGFGTVILTTPGGLPITWDTATQKLIHPVTKLPLSDEALKDKGSGEPFIRLDLLPVGVLMSGDVPVYFNKTTSQLVRYDGSRVSAIPGPGAKLDSSGALDLTDQTGWIPVAWDSVSNHLVYGPGHSQAGQPVTTKDLIDPSTKDLYLVTGQVFGLNFEIRPPVREFLMFDANV